MSVKQKLDKGGVYSKLDLAEIDPATRAEVEKGERAVAIIDEAKAEARKNDGGSFFDVYGADEVQKTHQITNAWKDKSEREVGNLASIKPLRMVVGDATSPFGFTWVLTDRDAQAVNEGRFCPHCLQAMASTIDPQCGWAYPKSDVKGCGWNRLHERFIDPSKELN